jgi:hypothetical protein
MDHAMDKQKKIKKKDKKSHIWAPNCVETVLLH